MKYSTLLFSIYVIIAFATPSKAQILDLTLDVSQMQNPDCWLNAGNVADNEVYLHAGACSSTFNFCNDSIAPSNSPIWEHVIGNWGMDDGDGQMNFAGNNIWTLNLDVDSYFSSAGLPSGATVYTIGLVFRSNDGSQEGKDDQCGDIYIVDVNTPNPRAIQGTTQAPFAPLSVSVATSVQGPRLASPLKLYPNPSQGAFEMTYEVWESIPNAELLVYNSLGQVEQVIYRGNQKPGAKSFQWESNQSGLYLVVLKNEQQVLSAEKVLVQQ